ncbi:hypothetical protein BRADI_1g35751v3, partial [Brachypodium distachyon]
VPLLLYGLGLRIQKKEGLGLTPGPPALLFIAKLLATLYLGPLVRDLHARHGPVISVRVFRTLIVFVADRRVAHRALVHGGATFADRPPLAEPAGLFSSGTRVVCSSPYGAYWSLVRRNLSAEATRLASRFAPARRRAHDALVRQLLLPAGSGGANVVPLRLVFRRAMFELLMDMCLGARLSPEALDEVQELQLRIARAINGFPVFYVVLAITKRLFWKRWRRYVAMRRRQEQILLPLIHASRREPGATSTSCCYADSLLALRLAEDEGGRPLTDGELVSLCSEFFNGGADTTVTAVEWIMAELVNRPDVQSKVYEEVKANPELSDSDMQSMPYLKAVVLEGLRLHPPIHVLIPHAVLSDGAEIGGYAVPKGAELNLVSVDFGRDDKLEIKMMPFGAGRRICPAYRLGTLHVEYFVGSLVRDLEWLSSASEGEQLDRAEELDFTVVMKHPFLPRVVPRTTT